MSDHYFKVDEFLSKIGWGHIDKKDVGLAEWMRMLLTAMLALCVALAKNTRALRGSND